MCASTLFSKVHITLPDKPLNIYHKKSQVDGPKILIIAGIHGDEIGGYKSADILTRVSVTKGELLIIPRANFLAILNNTRGYNGDMNKKFKKIDKNDKDKNSIELIKKTILDFNPDVLISLHEGYGFAKNSKNAWGNSIVIDEKKYRDFNLLETATFVQKNVNKHLDYKIAIKNTKTFSDPTETNKETFMLSDWTLRQNIKAFAIESSKNMELKKRIKTHLMMIKYFFDYYGLEIEPTMETVVNNIDFSTQTPTIVMKINNKIIKINKNSTLLLESGSKIEVIEVIGPNGSYIVPRGVDLNWKSFKFNNVSFDVKIDHKKIFTIKGKAVNNIAARHKKNGHIIVN